jgi:hypothetical protein
VRTWLGDSVMPVSSVPAPNFLARWRVVPPMPHPTSSTLPGEALAPENSSMRSVKSNLAILKSFFL